MITKATQHDIDRAGRRLLRQIFESLNFILNDTSDDYGIDYNVQVFEGKHPTGAWFLVQLKSSASQAYMADESAALHTLDLPHLEHFALALKQPMFIVLADVVAERLFFFSPQLIAKKVQAAAQSGQQTLTIRVPIANELPVGADSLVESLKRIQVILAAREFSDSTLDEFREAMSHVLDDSNFQQALQDKNDLLRLQRIADDHKSGRSDEALKRAESVQVDPDANAFAKFHSLSQIDAIEWSQALHAGKFGEALVAPHYKFASKAKALARSSGESWIRLASILIKTSADLEGLVFQDNSDYMTLRIHLQRAENPFLILGLRAKRSVNAKRILDKYSQGVRLVRLIPRVSEPYRLANAAARITQALAPYLPSLREADEQSEKPVVRSALSILDFVFNIAEQVGDEQGMGLSILASMSLAHDETSDAYKWAVDRREKMPDGVAKVDLEKSLARTLSRWKGTPQVGDYNPDPIWQIFQKVAITMGVDISDEKSLLVRRLRIAAKDDEPSEQMRFCEHVVVTVGDVSPIALYIGEVFGSTQAANKIIHCNKFGFHKQGIDAATAFGLFKSENCDHCTSRVPRPDSWRYTGEAREKFQQENMAFVLDAHEKGYGIRPVLKDDLEP